MYNTVLTHVCVLCPGAASIGERPLLSSSQTQFVRTISILSRIVPSFHDLIRLSLLVMNIYIVMMSLIG